MKLVVALVFVAFAARGIATSISNIHHRPVGEHVSAGCNAFANASTCNINANCEWNRFIASCIELCELIPTRAKCAAAAPSCRWRYPGVCTRNCGLEYVDEASCSADAACQWSPDTGLCTGQCGYAATPGVNESMVQVYCKEDSACQWNDYWGMCDPTCATAADPSTCALLAAGGWGGNATVNGYTTTCWWSQETGTCTSIDCSKLDGKECDKFGGNCVAYPSEPGPGYFCARPSDWCESESNPLFCIEIKNETTGASICNYRFGTCMPRCVVLHSRGSCITSPGCAWSERAGLCEDTCGALEDDESECIARGGCAWNSNTSECSVICSTFSNATECTAFSTECQWQGEKCVPGCSGFSIFQCSLWAGCVWASVGNQCIEACAALAADRAVCEVSPHCGWDTRAQTCITLYP
jgi:hypothetical protein